MTEDVPTPPPAPPQPSRPAERAGVVTSEFWLTVAALIIGATLVVVGAVIKDTATQDNGASIISWAVAGFAISRGITKGIGSKG